MLAREHGELNNSDMNDIAHITDDDSRTSDRDFQTLYSQVGGHVNMKIMNERFVCKPLNNREVRFYQKLPAQLEDVVPKYHGTIREDCHLHARYRHD